jgi:hypothetical protein
METRLHVKYVTPYNSSINIHRDLAKSHSDLEKSTYPAESGAGQSRQGCAEEAFVLRRRFLQKSPALVHRYVEFSRIEAAKEVPPFCWRSPTIRSGPPMDDYQKHLERQLQQQQQQLRLQAGELNAPRSNFQQPLQQLQQQRAQQPPPQWSTNIPQQPSVTPAAPGNPGFGRGISTNPMMISQHQQPTQQLPLQQNFSSTPSQTALNLAQPTTQKNKTSPSPASPVTIDTRIY